MPEVRASNCGKGGIFHGHLHLHRRTAVDVRVLEGYPGAMLLYLEGESIDMCICLTVDTAMTIIDRLGATVQDLQITTAESTHG